jgi:hypothetical protein
VAEEKAQATSVGWSTLMTPGFNFLNFFLDAFGKSPAKSQDSVPSSSPLPTQELFLDDGYDDPFASTLSHPSGSKVSSFAEDGRNPFGSTVGDDDPFTSLNSSSKDDSFLPKVFFFFLHTFLLLNTSIGRTV